MKPKIEPIIRIINLIIIFGLCILIYVNGEGLDCNKCELELSTSMPDFKSKDSYAYSKTTIKIVDLLDSLKKDYCILKWDKWGGWKISKNFSINNDG